MSESKRLFLLDAYALIYRSYYAFIKNPRINSKGNNTSAIFGFINTLEDILKRENPTHIAVCFDPPGPTFRHEAFELYKAQRDETPEVIKWSVPIIKEIIKAYRIPILEVSGFEADDVIGTISKKAEKEGYKVFMMTPDKDCGQLVSENIFMYRPKYGGNEYEILGIEEIKNKFEVDNPLQIIDLLGLMGDSSDNIPGCPGVGEKTAKKLLKEFGSIENIISGIEQLKGSLKEKISGNIENIRFSRFLATIKTDVPIEFDEKNLLKEDVNIIELKTIYEKLEFRSFIEKLSKSENPTSPVIKKTSQDNNQFSLWETAEEKPVLAEKFAGDTTDENKYSILKSLKDVPHSYHLIDNEQLFEDFLNIISDKKIICLDTETTNIDPIYAQLVGMSFSWEKNEAFYIPFPVDQKESQKKIEKLKSILENENLLIVGQNLKYDILVLKNYGINIRGEIFDTMIAHYLLQPELRHNMDFLAEVYLKYKTIHIEELIGQKGKGQKNMRDLKPEEICDYAAEDADITLQLKSILEEELKSENLGYLAYSVEMPLVKVLAEMEYNGVCLDTFSLAQSSVNMSSRLAGIENEIQKLAGIKFNVNSPKQLGEILFEKLEIEGKPKKTKTGQYSTSEENLESLKSKHPIIELILEQRGLKKLLSTYIDALPQLINPKTGNLHTSFNQAVTSTGRLSSSNPNLQNIPIRDEIGKEIRKAFIPEANQYFFSADYSQIELRLMAHLSQDPDMIEAFNSNKDIHAATASKIYKIPLEEVTQDMRRKAKTANFGIIYGISVFGLAERMAVSRGEAKTLIDGYFESYPLVKTYMEKAITDAKENGWVQTLFKRKRYLPDIHSHNAVVRGYAERNAINAPIQGAAADIIKIAMVNIQNAIEKNQLKSKMILQVHDELNFTVPKDELETLKSIVVNEMESAVKLSVPLKADTGYGLNWLEAH